MIAMLGLLAEAVLKRVTSAANAAAEAAKPRERQAGV